jgi:predicted  nucleic acid-binding Zn-ribbon protein
MPHQCVHCSKIYPVASKELLEGCSKCGGHFFFFIRDDQLDKIKEKPLEIPEEQKKYIEKEVREIVGATEESSPVILDLESVRISGSGKFELDIVKLFDKDIPVVYKLEEGKYIIDLYSTINKIQHENK